MHDSSPNVSGESSPSTVLKLLEALTYEEYLLAYPELTSMMHGRGREVRISADDQHFFSTFSRPVHLVTVVAPDSSGTAVVVPILERIGRSLPRCSFWITDLETGSELVRNAQGVPYSRRDIGTGDLPLLVVLDSEFRYLTDWGPHPQGFASRWDAWIAEHPESETDVHEAVPTTVDPLHEIRLWYNSGLTVECIAEIRQRLEAVSEDGTDPVDASESGVADSDVQR